MSEFVDGWILGDVLGEGAYGEVRLVVNKSTGEAVAMKMVDLSKQPISLNAIRKETTIHKMLSHPYIIQYFGQRCESNMEYIFLEYASGGELFDRIEPDVGMPIDEARKYFRQLVVAVEYLHSRGIAHRDLKPENLLLDANDNLKVSDFGLATVYRLHGKERYLNNKCGTLPYVAPEVFEQPYRAEPADIWSCGIILIALLAGELPWDEATLKCPAYKMWLENYGILRPWTKLDKLSFVFLKTILANKPSERSSLSDIKIHDWYDTGFDPETLSEPFVDTRLNIELINMRKKAFCFSQPESRPVGMSLSNMKFEERTGLSFSQPASVENLLVSSQLQAVHTQASQNTFQNLVRRMTRCFAFTNCKETVKVITNYLTSIHNNYRVDNFGTITVSIIDKRRMPLVFKINIIDMDNKTLIDFRLSKGCGIEFKKKFIHIKNSISHILSTSCYK